MSQIKAVSLLHLMQEDDHPEDEIKAAVGNLDQIEMAGESILIGLYVQQGKTKGGLITQSLSIESIYQGKVGLVLKTSNQDFTDQEKKAWGGEGRLPKVGEWVFFKADDGIALSVLGTGAKRSPRLTDLGIEMDGWPCRVFEPRYILGRIKSPRSVV